MKYLYSFRYFIKQNVQVVACLPKYSDPRSTFHFQVSFFSFDLFLSFCQNFQWNNLRSSLFTRIFFYYVQQDYSVPENSSKRISEHDIFLYNQNPTSNKGIACLAFTIVDENSDTIECTDELDASIKHTSFEAPSLDNLKLITSTKSVKPGELVGGNLFIQWIVNLFSFCHVSFLVLIYYECFRLLCSCWIPYLEARKSQYGGAGIEIMPSH